jgi:hypothetical protein
MSPRRLACTSALCALGAVVAGCGGSGATRTTPRTATHAAATRLRSPALRPTRAEALAYARAVNLKASDIAEATVSQKRTRSRSNTAATGREVGRCERFVSHQHRLAEKSSSMFTRGAELEKEEMGSGVTVVADQRLAARTVTAIGSRAAHHCLERALSRALARESLHGAHFRRVRVSGIPVRAPGAAAAAGIRVSASVTIPYAEVNVPFYVDALACAVGRAEVWLITISITQPVPAITERQLFSRLLSRAEAHVL